MAKVMAMRNPGSIPALSSSKGSQPLKPGQGKGQGKGHLAKPSSAGPSRSRASGPHSARAGPLSMSRDAQGMLDKLTPHSEKEQQLLDNFDLETAFKDAETA